MSLLLVGVGLAVAATFVVGPSARDAEATGPTRNVADARPRPEAPVVSEKVSKSLEKKAAAAKAQSHKKKVVVRGPKDKTLTVTIPAMNMVSSSKIPYTGGRNMKAFKEHAGVHLKGTGQPWDPVANVYIAGHRLGYPGTDSFLAFWDLNVLHKGDKIFVSDADGKRYVYKVYKHFVVPPSEVSVTQPVKGRNILTLQTCTLPDYSKRLIVRAQKVT